MGSKTVETLVGAVVVAAAIFFFIFAYNKSDVARVSGYNLTGSFSSVGSLKPGDEVRLSGIKVGSVTDLRLDPKYFQAIVTMSIDNNINLPDDTSANISADGLLGGTFVSLQPGFSDETLANGDEIAMTQGAVNIMDLISRALFGGVSQTGEGGG
jgi:phospholipid/cholesterol/gamma-HCH transport system substrate-binding protein